ncbi:hypothetical protein EVAR_70083_1 [Eumeta japonica]|uniref:Uncharacterized protein n=1 Tax=Eumeta variegata TaxID=151549 RepID=A0A4C1SY31_EUMVA|nr:hypothetical protein EVAR_70083_1 [Eumeta japonica]
MNEHNQQWHRMLPLNQKALRSYSDRERIDHNVLNHSLRASKSTLSHRFTLRSLFGTDLSGFIFRLVAAGPREDRRREIKTEVWREIATGRMKRELGSQREVSMYSIRARARKEVESGRVVGGVTA